MTRPADSPLETVEAYGVPATAGTSWQPPVPPALQAPQPPSPRSILAGSGWRWLGWMGAGAGGALLVVALRRKGGLMTLLLGSAAGGAGTLAFRQAMSLAKQGTAPAWADYAVGAASGALVGRLSA